MRLCAVLTPALAAAALAIAGPGQTVTALANAGMSGGSCFSKDRTYPVSLFVVPSGVHMVHVVAVGGTGQHGSGDGGTGGPGAVVTADVPVTPGERLDLEGGANGGVQCQFPPDWQGGANGGSTGWGGTASSLLVYDDSTWPITETPLVIAAGGGGGGDTGGGIDPHGGGYGGAGGTPNGGDGSPGDGNEAVDGANGYGATQASGGAGGANGYSNPFGGSPSKGTAGGTEYSTGGYLYGGSGGYGDSGGNGGGGGGGYHGGGGGGGGAGGGAGGGGGGGSSWVTPGAVNVSYSNDSTASPSISVTAIVDTTLTLSAPTPVFTGQPVTLTAHLTRGDGSAPGSSVDFRDLSEPSSVCIVPDFLGSGCLIGYTLPYTDLGSATVDATGQATFSTSFSQPGFHNVEALYGDSLQTFTATAGINAWVYTTISLNVPSVALPNQPVTLTAHLTRSDGSAPGSQIIFEDLSEPSTVCELGSFDSVFGCLIVAHNTFTGLGIGTVDANGNATVTASFSQPGVHTIYVDYFDYSAGEPYQVTQDLTIASPEGSPVLTSLSPAAATAGSSGLTLTLNGSNFAADAALLWNGHQRPLDVLSSNQATVNLTAADLATSASLTTDSVEVVNTGFEGGTSAALAFLVEGPTVASGQGTAVPPGGTGTVSNVTPGQAGVTATLDNAGGTGSATVAVATYSTTPVGPALAAGSDYYDIQVTGASAGASLSTTIAYPSSITGAAESTLTLKYWTGSAWAPVLSSGGSPPYKDTANKDFAVTFDATSTPALSQLTGTVFSATPNVQAISFPTPAESRYGDGPVALTATASSGLPVTYSLGPGPQACSLSGASAVIEAAGSCLILADQAGDESWVAAPEVGATLVIDPAPLTITADDQSKPYGAPLPELTASYSGLVNGDTPASLVTAPTLATAATAASHVSALPYPIAVGGAVDPNYAITYVAGSLAVTPVPLTITADDQSKVYGAALPALTASYSGLVNGDTPSSLTTPPALTTTATAASHVAGSPYPITASGAADGDYSISYAGGRLTVMPAPLTITADDQGKVYGAPLPALTATYSGLVNGDTPASLATPPALATTATGASHVAGSPYAITASGAADTDYSIAYRDGRLTITPAPLGITADDKTKVYGGPLPALTASYDGFVNGDAPSSLATAPELGTTATGASDVGAYAITASGAEDSDYAFTYTPGTLTVTTAPLAVVVNDAQHVYHQPNPTFTGYVGTPGLVNGDTLGGTVTVIYSTALDSSTPAGTYPGAIVANIAGAHAFDYSPTFHDGTLTITRMPTALAFTRPSFVAPLGSVAVVTAVLKEALSPSGLIAGAAVTCSFGPGVTSAATTDGSGIAGCSMGGLADGAYQLGAAFAGDNDYQPSSAAPAPLYTYAPTRFVAWGGTQLQPGQDVYFWGSQWVRHVSGGSWSGDSAFKGYADSVSGTAWTAKEGDSSLPPPTVAQYIGVLVSNQAGRSGSLTTGNVVGVVVLRVDNPAAYAPDPSHFATGVVEGFA